MEDAKELFARWQEYFLHFQPVFTSPGWMHFFQFVTGIILCDEPHPLTKLLTALGFEEHWRSWEQFLECGVWDERQVEEVLIRLTDRQDPARFANYRPIAVDDTLARRWSPHVWGTVTLKKATRDTNLARVVRGNNWVAMGDLAPGDPWIYRPLGGRVYLQHDRLPRNEVFKTRLELAVEMLREVQENSAAPVLAVLDGGFARQNVMIPCSASPRPIAVLTRPRVDARLYRPLSESTPGTNAAPHAGRPRKWGQRLPSPKNHDQWETSWEEGEAYIYGRKRRFRCKRLTCRWSVSGPDIAVRAYVFEVKGYSKPWFLITTALELTPDEVVEAYAARFRQEDGIRDQKQWMGMEESRAWTKKPIWRTFLAQGVAMTMLRLLGKDLERTVGRFLRPKPGWYPHKKGTTILDLRRLLWSVRGEFSQLMREQIKLKKPLHIAA